MVVQNFRPGGADRAGMGYEQCKKWNQNIIYCSSSGFGPEGPLADQRIYDMIIQVRLRELKGPPEDSIKLLMPYQF